MFDHGIITDFVREWGYFAVFIGSIFEGEVILITASAIAALGYLSIYKIFFLAFTTTVIVDQLLFWVGYKIGTDWIIKRIPKLEKARDKVFSLLHRMDILFIFAFRFIYGIRTVSPLVIGSAKIRPARFVFFNILSGLCWALIGCFLGYTIADVVMDGKFDTLPAAITVLAIIIIIFGLSMVIKRIKKR
jgi:membrane protein DedA with SNARE-associated domain